MGSNLHVAGTNGGAWISEIVDRRADIRKGGATSKVLQSRTYWNSSTMIQAMAGGFTPKLTGLREE